MSMFCCVGLYYLIFCVAVYYCLRFHISDAFKNMDIRGVGKRIEGFVSGSGGNNDQTIFYGKGIESKPGCCQANPDESTGCLCVNAQHIDLIRKRGGNNVLNNK